LRTGFAMKVSISSVVNHSVNQRSMPTKHRKEPVMPAFQYLAISAKEKKSLGSMWTQERARAQKQELATKGDILLNLGLWRQPIRVEGRIETRGNLTHVRHAKL